MVAQTNAAYMTEKNLGYSGDDSKNLTFVLWSLSAIQGDSDAERSLGDFHYYKPNATEYDYAVAANHYRMSGEKHNAHALFNLGFIYQFGLGVNQDLHLAKRYYDLALTESKDAYWPCSLGLFALKIQTWILEQEAVATEFSTQASKSDTSDSKSQEQKTEDLSHFFDIQPLLDLIQGYYGIEIQAEDLVLACLIGLLVIILFIRYHPR
jgi:TPR repeat protein